MLQVPVVLAEHALSLKLPKLESDELAGIIISRPLKLACIIDAAGADLLLLPAAAIASAGFHGHVARDDDRRQDRTMPKGLACSIRFPSISIGRPKPDSDETGDDAEESP